MCLIQLILIGHLYLRGMWIGVAPRTDAKKASHVYRGLDYNLRNTLTILGSVVNRIEGDRPVWQLNEHENFTLILNKDIHISSKTDEESGYGLNLALLTISC